MSKMIINLLITILTIGCLKINLCEKDFDMPYNEITGSENITPIVELAPSIAEENLTEDLELSQTDLEIETDIKENKNAELSDTNTSISKSEVKQEIMQEIKNDNISNVEHNVPSESAIIQEASIPVIENNITNWCVEGGNIHLAGDAENEHGYYPTWESTYQAFEEYTKDWESCNYKINSCACGLYYFWAVR